MLHICKPGTWKAGTEDSLIQGQPGLHIETQTNKSPSKTDRISNASQPSPSTELSPTGPKEGCCIKQDCSCGDPPPSKLLGKDRPVEDCTRYSVFLYKSFIPQRHLCQLKQCKWNVMFWSKNPHLQENACSVRGQILLLTGGNSSNSCQVFNLNSRTS